jgi:hypothetical protein
MSASQYESDMPKREAALVDDPVLISPAKCQNSNVAWLVISGLSRPDSLGDGDYSSKPLPRIVRKESRMLQKEKGFLSSSSLPRSGQREL